MTQALTRDSEYRNSVINRLGFQEIDTPSSLDPAWHTFALKPEYGTGHFHILASPQGWTVTIYDFTLKDDQVFDFQRPGYIGVSWNEIIAGEEFNPYRKLRSKSLWGFYGDADGWRGFVHGNIPVRSVSVGIEPEFAQSYIKSQWDNKFPQIHTAFSALQVPSDIAALKPLLANLRPRLKAEPLPVSYYEQSVLDVLDIVVSKSHEIARILPRTVSEADQKRIRAVAQFVDDHYSGVLRIADLSRAAQMSPTKFKECFKAVMGTTFTQYILSRRISQAELLLQEPSLSIEFVAHMVGYSCVSRFTQLFNRETGMLPSEYRTCFKK